MHSRVAVIAVGVVVVLAGCGAVSQPTTPSAQTPTPQATPDQDDSNDSTSRAEPTRTETATPAPDPLTYALASAPNMDAARADVVAALQQWEGSSYADRPLKFVNSTATADYVVRFRPTIAQCDGERANVTFFWCVGDDNTVTVVSRYIAPQQAEFTERAIGVTVAGENYDDVPWYTDVPDVEYKSPFLSNTVTVALTEPGGAVTARERQAFRTTLSYWNANAARYGEWTATFLWTNDTERADVEVRMVVDIQRCAGIVDALGCAPVLSGNVSVTSQQLIQIERGFTQESTARIMKHEFGHLLGLRHGDPPQPLMDGTFDPVRAGDVQDLQTRDYGFDEDTLSVYIAHDTFDASRRQVRDEVIAAIEWYEAGHVSGTPDDFALSLTENKTRADVWVRHNTSACEGEYAVCSVPYSSSVDTDDAAEYYTFATINLDVDDTEIAYWFAHGLGYPVANTPGLDNAPPQGVDAYEREEWPDT